MKIFGREPAIVLGFVAAVVQLASGLFMHWSVEQQGVINAVAAALVGVIAAFAVSQEKGFAAITGLVKALMALALAFGLALSPELQSSIMVFVTAVGALVIRDHVVAPVAPGEPEAG